MKLSVHYQQRPAHRPCMGTELKDVLLSQDVWIDYCIWFLIAFLKTSCSFKQQLVGTVSLCDIRSVYVQSKRKCVCRCQLCLLIMHVLSRNLKQTLYDILFSQGMCVIQEIYLLTGFTEPTLAHRQHSRNHDPTILGTVFL